MTLAAKDAIRVEAARFLVSSGQMFRGALARGHISRAITERGEALKLAGWQLIHDEEVARAAFYRTMSHGRTLAEAREAAARSIDLMLGVQILQATGWTWVGSEPSKPLYAGKGVKPRPSSELEAFRAKHPDRLFRPAYYSGK